jgi:hypothetical protein
MDLKIENALVIEVGETVLRGSNNFEVREIVVQSEPTSQYPQYHKINFNGDKAEDLDDIEEGDIVNINVNVNGRKYVDKDGKTQYFNSLDGWKIKKPKDQSKAGQSSTTSYSYQQPVDISSAPDEDDLPF